MLGSTRTKKRLETERATAESATVDLGAEDDASNTSNGSGGSSEGSSGVPVPDNRPERSEWDRYFRFGLLDNAFLIAPALAGFELEDTLAEIAPNAAGYGPLIGAVTGNAISNSLAGGLGEGPYQGAASFAGALTPLVPIVAMMALGQNLNTPAKWILGASAVGLGGYTVYKGNQKKARYRKRLQAWEQAQQEKKAASDQGSGGGSA